PLFFFFEKWKMDFMKKLLKIMGWSGLRLGGIAKRINLKGVKKRLSKLRKFMKILKKKLGKSLEKISYFFEFSYEIFMFSFFILFAYIFYSAYFNDYEIIVSINKINEAKVEFFLISFFLLIFSYLTLKRIKKKFMK
ncbi:MAG: hypothetical protein QW673_02075, partial [Candidatus Thermoplasmatota archaeon]